MGSHAGPHAPQDYEKLDAYYVTLTVHKQRKSQGDELAPHLEATIRGLEEHQPPVMAGDTVRLRHDTEPQVEVRGLHGARAARARAARGAGCAGHGRGLCGAWAFGRCFYHERLATLPNHPSPPPSASAALPASPCAPPSSRWDCAWSTWSTARPSS